MWIRPLQSFRQLFTGCQVGSARQVLGRSGQGEHGFEGKMKTLLEALLLTGPTLRCVSAPHFFVNPDAYAMKETACLGVLEATRSH
jgi:hypothetical protein